MISRDGVKNDLLQCGQLQEKVESLCQECDDLRFRAKSSEEALQRDADTKVQVSGHFHGRLMLG